MDVTDSTAIVVLKVAGAWNMGEKQAFLKAFLNVCSKEEIHYCRNILQRAERRGNPSKKSSQKWEQRQMERSKENETSAASGVLQTPDIVHPIHLHQEEDLDVLLKGIDIISLQRGTPGFLSVYGSEAFPIVAALQLYTKNYKPIIAGGRLGQGKIVGTSHDGFFHPEDDEHRVMTGRKRFLLNAIEWAGRPGSDLTGPPNVGLLAVSVVPSHYWSSSRAFLAEYDIGLSTVRLGGLKDSADLSKFDVLITNDYLTVGEAKIVREYVENGGGLLMGRTGWADQSVKEGEHFGETYTPNMITSGAGFVFRNDHVYAAPETDAGFSVAYDKLANTHVQEACEGLKNQPNANAENASQHWAIVDGGLRFIPSSDDVNKLLCTSLSIQ